MKTNYWVLLVFFCASCSVSKQSSVPLIAKQTYTFDYTPKESSKAASASMVLALIRPSYATDFGYSAHELFQRFKEGLAGDIEELIVGKGFSLKGPYTGRDEMIFEDKKRIDMAVIIEITPAFTDKQGSWQRQYHANLWNPAKSYYSFSYSGKTSLTGKINISGVEPLTGERIWSKSVAIPDIENISIVTQHSYLSELTDIALMEDPSVYNAVGAALKSQYTGIMDKIAAHFNVEELSSLKTQIAELKSKKGF